MSYDPIGRVLQVTSLGQQKEKLNHVPNTVINPLQLTGKKMKTIIEQNPPGTIPIPSKTRSITIDVVGKPKKVFKEDNVDLSRSKRSVERHLQKPFGYSERILSRSKNQRDSSQNKTLNNTTYHHPDVWNQSINTESKRKAFNLTKEETLKSLRSMNKTQRDEFIFKSHNQAKTIELFYYQLRKILKQRDFIRQYGEDIDSDAQDSELLNKLFNAYVRLRNIYIGQRTDQKFIYLDELKDFFYTIGFSSNEMVEQSIEGFFDQIYNPNLLQDAKHISKKPSLHSLRSLNIVEQLVPGQSMIKKVDMISMRAVIYNYKKYIHEHYEIHEKFSRTAAKQLLVDLLANINPWVYKKQLLKFTMKKSQQLEEEFFTIENLSGNAQMLKKINKKIKERNEQIDEKLILSKFIHEMVRNQFLQIDKLKDYFVKQIVSKAEKISYLEDFIAGLLNYLQASDLTGQDTQQQQQEEQENVDERQSEDNQDGQYHHHEEQIINRQLHLERIADFIHSNKYRGEQHDIILNFLVRIRKQVNEESESQNKEFIMSDDVTNFCTQYKARQDFKQSVIKQFIEKAKNFYDKHIGDADINEENRKKFDSNTIGTYTLKKMQKYDNIIGSRALKINEILNLVQKRIIFGVESCHYDGPLNDNDFFESIENILNSDKQEFKMNNLFSDNFVHAFIEDYLEIQEKERLKARCWDDEIKQALSLYQRESQRLLNVVQTWKPQEKQKKQQAQSPSASAQKTKSNIQRNNVTDIKNQQANKLNAQQLNRQFLQNFIDDEEKEIEKQSQKMDSQRSSRNQNSARGGIPSQLKTNIESKTEQGSRIKKQQPSSYLVQQNIKDQQKRNSTSQQQQALTNQQNQKDKRGSITTQDRRQQQQQSIQPQQVIKNSTRNSVEQIKIQGKTLNTQENENLSFFEYIDNQYGFSEDKNSSFQSKQGQQHNVNANNKPFIVPPLPIQQKVNNMQNNKDPSPAHSGHNDQSTLNKTNQDSLANDPQIQKTNQMYNDLYNILNIIKDEFDIV